MQESVALRIGRVCESQSLMELLGGRRRQRAAFGMGRA